MAEPLFSAWHDFYTLTGEAAATLVGLMFVAASVGSGVFTQARQAGLRTFLSPTVVAFSVVLASSLITTLPALGWRVPAVLFGSMGALGLIYSWRVWRKMTGHGFMASIDREDRAWYMVVPALAYLLLFVSAATLAIQPELACGLLAATVSLLLLAGIRNAWDMTTWAILRSRD